MSKIIDNKEYLSIKEASAYLNISRQRMYEIALPQGRVMRRSIGRKYYVLKYDIEMLKEAKILIEKNELSPYYDEPLEWDESLKYIESFHNPNSIKMPTKYNTSCRYAVTNKGRIINLSSGKTLEPQPTTDGYFQVGLMLKNANVKYERIHVLVAYMWCENGKYKVLVHHINENIADNRPENLIWLTIDEHLYAHELLDEAKKTGDYSCYHQFIHDMRLDNRIEKDYRCIAIESNDNIEFFYSTPFVYNAYMQGEMTLEEVAIFSQSTVLNSEEVIKPKNCITQEEENN